MSFLLRHEQQEQRLEAAALDPRTFPSKGAATCKYWRWSRRSASQRQVQARYSSSLLSLPASARKINLILRFRLGCLRQLPVVQGRHDNIPREQRFCWHRPFHVGDEKHLIFDCPAFAFLREHHARLFVEQQTVRGFMNQDSQKSVLHFICDCLEHGIVVIPFTSTFLDPSEYKYRAVKGTLEPNSNIINLSVEKELLSCDCLEHDLLLASLDGAVAP